MVSGIRKNKRCSDAAIAGAGRGLLDSTVDYAISSGNKAVASSDRQSLGGKATRFTGYGIIASNSLIISCGSLIAAGTSGSKNICALNMPLITLPGTPYWWRTSDSGAYTASTDTAYTLSSSHSYVEIRTAYTVPFRRRRIVSSRFR